MEGLIPMVYRAIKRYKVRRRYDRLSSHAAQNYNISDFCQPDNGTRSPCHFHLPAPPPSNEMVDRDTFMGEGLCSNFHRSTAVGYSFGKRFSLEDNTPTPEKQRMVWFRSIQMLSCLTGI